MLKNGIAIAFSISHGWKGTTEVRPEHEEVMSHYAQALQIKLDHVEAHNNLGVALGRQGKLKEAMGHFSEVLRIKPDDVEASRNLDRVMKLMGKSASRSPIGVGP